MSDFIVTVTIWVQPEHWETFLAATRDNVAHSRKEPGNRQFDCAQAEDDPNRFHYYERYDSVEAFQAHQRSPHYLRWRAIVDPIMAQRREGRKWTLIADH
jgi:autoinducer 2-degrading protein